eukprot:SAG11_NODE_2540_length_3240_cov_5.748886_2_plen_57_part_00
MSLPLTFLVLRRPLQFAHRKISFPQLHSVSGSRYSFESYYIQVHSLPQVYTDYLLM